MKKIQLLIIFLLSIFTIVVVFLVNQYNRPVANNLDLSYQDKTEEINKETDKSFTHDEEYTEPDTSPDPEAEISIEEEIIREEIPFNIIERQDPNLEEGQTILATEGIKV